MFIISCKYIHQWCIENKQRDGLDAWDWFCRTTYPSKTAKSITTTCLWLVDFFTYLSDSNPLETLLIWPLFRKLNSCPDIGCPVKCVSLLTLYIYCVVISNIQLWSWFEKIGSFLCLLKKVYRTTVFWNR